MVVPVVSKEKNVQSIDEELQGRGGRSPLFFFFFLVLCVFVFLVFRRGILRSVFSFFFLPRLAWVGGGREVDGPEEVENRIPERAIPQRHKSKPHRHASGRRGRRR